MPVFLLPSLSRCLPDTFFLYRSMPGNKPEADLEKAADGALMRQQGGAVC